jgi:hypothetical protein
MTMKEAEVEKNATPCGLVDENVRPGINCIPAEWCCKIDAIAAQLGDSEGEAATTEPDTPAQCTGVKTRVRFSEVRVRTFGLVLGDHPSVEFFPLSLDWVHTADSVIGIDEYETSRAATRAAETSPLTITQRRSRLSKVSGIPETDLQLQDDLRILQEDSWEDSFENEDSYDNDEDGGDDDDDAEEDSTGGEYLMFDIFNQNGYKVIHMEPSTCSDFRE